MSSVAIQNFSAGTINANRLVSESIKELVDESRPSTGPNRCLTFTPTRNGIVPRSTSCSLSFIEIRKNLKGRFPSRIDVEALRPVCGESDLGAVRDREGALRAFLPRVGCLGRGEKSENDQSHHRTSHGVLPTATSWSSDGSRVCILLSPASFSSALYFR